MSYSTAIAMVLACAAVAGILSYCVSRLVSLDLRRRHHEVGGQVFQLIGVLFSVILAFVFNEVWSQYNTAAQSISSECGALHGAVMLANALPDKKGRPINLAILAYSREVVGTEWPSMATQRRSVEAAHDLRAVIDIAARMDVTRPSEVASRSEILSLLSQAHADRETRTFQLDLGLPFAMWVVLIVFAIFLEAFVMLAGIEAPGNVIFACSFAALIVAVLVLVRMLDYPFEGALALSNQDFVKLTGQVSALVSAH